MKSVVITGVSTGIGRGIASVLASAGWRVFGSVRSEADAAKFEADFGPKAEALVFDVTDCEGISAAAAHVETELGDQGLGALVNNAGISIVGPMEHVPLDRLRTQLEVNVVGLVAVTKAFLPLLGSVGRPRKKPGKIINISSVSGRRALPFFGPYAASKFAVEALTDSMRRELVVHGIDVIAIEPGPIRSEIWGKAQVDEMGLEATPYAPALATIRKLAARSVERALPAEDVGRLALRLLNNPRPPVRTIIQKGGIWPFLAQSLPPARMLDGMIARTLGLKRRKS